MLEKIITLIAALIASLDANTAALKGAAPTAAAAAAGETKEAKAARIAAEKAAKAAAEAAAGGVTVTHVRDAATAYLAAQKDKVAQKTFIDALNAKHGSKRITEAPAEKFAEIVAELKAETEKVTSGGGAGDSGI